jgi:type IV pilus assembly protein PilA
VEHIGTNGRRLERGSAGFTLLELMIVVTILGILLAVGIPTLLGAKNRASDAAAKSAATRALKSQKVLYSDKDQQYGDAAAMKAVEPNLDAADYAAGPVPQVLGRVFVRNENGSVVTMVARSATGTCFWTRDENGVTSYATNDCSGVPTTFTSSW